MVIQVLQTKPEDDMYGVLYAQFGQLLHLELKSVMTRWKSSFRLERGNNALENVLERFCNIYIYMTVS